MKPFPALALLVAAACGAAQTPSAAPPRPAAAATAKAAPAVPIVSNTAGYRFAGFVWERALAALPPGSRRPTFGHPDHVFRVGTIGDAETWDTFAAAAELRDVPDIDFTRQMVVFAVLDARTSTLSPATWKLDAAGRAVFTFEESGAEPFPMGSRGPSRWSTAPA